MNQQQADRPPQVIVAGEASRVGSRNTIDLVVSAPRSEGFVVHHSLPAGFLIDESSVQGGELVRADDAGIELRVEAGHDGLVELRYDAVPTLAGELWTGPATVALLSDPDLIVAVPPERWVVR